MVFYETHIRVFDHEYDYSLFQYHIQDGIKCQFLIPQLRFFLKDGPKPGWRAWPEKSLALGKLSG